MKKRIVGLDILRFLSMFGIIGLHVINQGGLINNANVYSIKYYVILVLLVIFYTSVNLFGMLSGYLNIFKEKNKNSRIIELIVITIFYCIIITSIFYCINYKGVQSNGTKEFIYNLIPILDGRYWYLSSYIFLFFLIPYINTFCKSLNKKQFYKLLIILFILLTIIPNILETDVFKIYNGYSPFWLLYCYLVGAYIRLYNIKINFPQLIKTLTLVFIVTFLLNAISRYYIYYTLNRVVLITLFMSYVSPFILYVTPFTSNS